MTGPSSACEAYPLGVSRPDLAVMDLPTPEEVFGVSRIGLREVSCDRPKSHRAGHCDR